MDKAEISTGPKAESTLAEFGSKYKNRLISYPRLTEDMLSHLYEVFGVQKRKIPIPRCEVNWYVTDFVGFLCRQTKLYQIVYRPSFHLLFVHNDAATLCMNDVNELKTFVASCVDSVRDELRAEGQKCVSPELFNLSLACVAELSLFYVSKHRYQPLKKMAEVWFSYFEASVIANLAVKGEVIRMLQNGIQKASVDRFLSSFIPKYCVPYSGEDVDGIFTKMLAIDTARNLKNEEEIARVEELRRLMYADFKLQPLSQQDLYEESQSDTKPLKVHERLGIVVHEDILNREFKPNLPVEDGSVSKVNRKAKAIAALVRAAERKKTRDKMDAKTLSGDSVVKSHLLKTASDVAGASNVRDNPEVDLASLSLDHTPDLDLSSRPDSPTTIQLKDYSAQGARPKNRKYR